MHLILYIAVGSVVGTLVVAVVGLALCLGCVPSAFDTAVMH
jgi:hypothetical protein